MRRAWLLLHRAGRDKKHRSAFLPSIGSKIVCVFLATQLLFHREALSCQAWEYRSSSGECCPKCASGSRVAKPCTSSSSTRCVPCSEGTYTDHPNGLAECFRCLPCDPGAHLKVKEECTYTKNTVCTCIPGYFCSHPMNEKPCEICTQHTVSPPGYMVIQEGTETNDTKFVRCPLGTFSEMEMSSSCEPWTDCSKEGLVEVRSGSASLDAVCGRPKPGKRSRAPLYPLLIVGFLLLVVSPLGMIYRRGQQSSKKGDSGQIIEHIDGTHSMPLYSQQGQTIHKQRQRLPVFFRLLEAVLGSGHRGCCGSIFHAKKRSCPSTTLPVQFPLKTNKQCLYNDKQTQTKAEASPFPFPASGGRACLHFQAIVIS